MSHFDVAMSAARDVKPSHATPRHLTSRHIITKCVTATCELQRAAPRGLRQVKRLCMEVLKDCRTGEETRPRAQLRRHTVLELCRITLHEITLCCLIFPYVYPAAQVARLSAGIALSDSQESSLSHCGFDPVRSKDLSTISLRVRMRNGAGCIRDL